MQREYMTISEAAKALDVSTTTIWRRVRAGELEVFRSQADRRERLVRRSDIEKMLQPTPEGKELAA